MDKIRGTLSVWRNIFEHLNEFTERMEITTFMKVGFISGLVYWTAFIWVYHMNCVMLLYSEHNDIQQSCFTQFGPSEWQISLHSRVLQRYMNTWALQSHRYNLLISTSHTLDQQIAAFLHSSVRFRWQSTVKNFNHISAQYNVFFKVVLLTIVSRNLSGMEITFSQPVPSLCLLCPARFVGN